MRSYFSPGKIMLCGEYAVTIGVEALAVPTKVGQWMHIWEFDSIAGGDRLIWEAKEKDGTTWLNDSFALPLAMDQTQTELPKERKLLMNLLLMADASIWKPGKSYRIETQLEFERSSGLGSSSTLIANFSRFAGLDPQKVQQKIFGGSGYDVAVAELGKGLMFWKSQEMVHWGPWELSPSLTQNWKVVFLGEKQNSRDALNNVKLRLQEIQQDDFLLHQLQQVCAAVKLANQIPMLEAGLEMWQAILAMSLGLQTPYQHFGFQPVKGGLCKWLGAWGGDMLLVNGVFEELHRSALEKYKLVAWNQIVSTSKDNHGSY